MAPFTPAGGRASVRWCRTAKAASSRRRRISRLTFLLRRLPQLRPFQVFVEARHDLDEVARLLPVVELAEEDAVPGVLAGSGRAGQHEDELALGQPCRC